MSSVGNYMILDELGSGAFATVYLAHSMRTNEKYALKVIPKANLIDSGNTERFQHEIDTMYILSHPNLVKLHDFFWDDENFYVVLDFCAGGDLLKYILEGDKLDESSAALIFKQIIDAVAYFHSFGVAHRDLKLENILIDNFPHIKITDFGLCGFYDENQLMKTFCGSPCYCAPECISHIKYDGKLADIWSLGVILYTLVFKEAPWNTKNQSIMIRQICKASYTVPKSASPELKSLIQSILVLKPEDRPSLEYILGHPWIKKAETNQFNRSLPQSNLPKLPKESVAEIAMKTRQASRSESGIFSPFPSDDEDFRSRNIRMRTSESEDCLPLATTLTPSLPIFSYKQKKVHGQPTISLAPKIRTRVGKLRNRQSLNLQMNLSSITRESNHKIDTIREE